MLVESRAAVSCSPVAYRLGGAGFGFWLTGKLGRAWHWCMAVHGVVVLGLAYSLNLLSTNINTLLYPSRRDPIQLTITSHDGKSCTSC